MSPPPKPLAILAVSAWVGLLVGASESGVAWASRAFGARVTLVSLRVNRHALWMIPVADLALFAAIGVLLAGMSLLSPRITRRVAGPALAIPAFAAVLMGVTSLHWAARWVLAAGLGMQAALLARRFPDALARTVRFTLPAMAAGLAIFGPFEYFRVAHSESRALAELAPSPKHTPNVILLVMDTVRADHLSLYGYHRSTTPNLARLAKGAVRFDSAISPAPWTLPSHASMFTGRWPHELSTAVDRPLDGAFPTLAEALAERGYATGGFVANTYYCNAAYGIDRGFHRYEDLAANATVSPYEIARSASLGERLLKAMKVKDVMHAGDARIRKTADRVNADMLAWIDAHRDRPFFAFANYYDAHGPYAPPDDASRRFGLSTLPTSEREKILGQRHRITGRKPAGPLSEADQAAMGIATELLRDSYDDCLAALDHALGDLFDSLDRRGLRDNTVIVVTSDHGEHFGEHSLFGHGVSLYQPEVHVPLLVFAPGGPRGRVVTETVSLRNLPATVLDLVAPGARSPFPGRSLARFFDPGPEASEAVLTEVEHQKKFAPSATVPASRGPVQGVIEGRWSYIRHADGSEELYDVEADPGQGNDLLKSGEATPTVARLRAAMDRIDRGESALAPRMAGRDAPDVERN